MSTTIKKQLREVMLLAWQFVRRNGYTMSEALKCAWANIKLYAKLHTGICKFYFQKVDGTLREAYGTLKESLIAPIQGDDNRKRNDTVQVYYDTEREAYRCFKKANLIKVV
jgi:hypothetical protein